MDSNLVKASSKDSSEALAVVVEAAFSGPFGTRPSKHIYSPTSSLEQNSRNREVFRIHHFTMLIISPEARRVAIGWPGTACAARRKIAPVCASRVIEYPRASTWSGPNNRSLSARLWWRLCCRLNEVIACSRMRWEVCRSRSRRRIRSLRGLRAPKRTTRVLWLETACRRACRRALSSRPWLSSIRCKRFSRSRLG